MFLEYLVDFTFEDEIDIEDRLKTEILCHDR